MTRKQQEEFAKLQLTFLEKVREGDGREQLELMEVIFHWMKKQMINARKSIVDVLPPMERESLMPVDIEPNLKGEFTFLQMAMIVAAGKNDKAEMVEIELRMREWVDIQIQRAVNAAFKPKLKILRGGGQ